MTKQEALLLLLNMKMVSSESERVAFSTQHSYDRTEIMDVVPKQLVDDFIMNMIETLNEVADADE